MFERDVFCPECGERIDTLQSPVKTENGMVESMIISDARRSHMLNTGCPGRGKHAEGWIFGVWRECPKTPEREYSDDRKSLALEIRETLHKRGHWCPQTDGPDLIQAVGLALDHMQEQLDKANAAGAANLPANRKE